MVNKPLDKNMLNKLYISHFKNKRLRNICAILSVILTIVLFTTLFTIVSSLLDTAQCLKIREVGTNAHVFVENICKSEYVKIKTNKTIKKYGLSEILSTSENPEIKSYDYQIKHIDKNKQKFNSIKLLRGNMPDDENEVALDTTCLRLLGIPEPKIGQKIKLVFSIREHKIEHEFILSGYWEKDSINLNNDIYISDEYIDKIYQTQEYQLNYGDRRYNLDINYKNNSNLSKKIKELREFASLYNNEVFIRINPAYTNDNLYKILGSSSIFTLAVCIICIIFCGYLFIYNVFYATVLMDIKYYATLKLLGATRKQIKYIIRKQAYLIFIIGSIIGLVLGYIIGIKITPNIVKSLDISMVKLSANPLIFIFSTIFTYVTLLISIYKPSKIASRVSTIEVLKDEGNINFQNDEIKSYRKTNKNKIFIMAKNNVLRNKKRALFVFISMALCLVLLNITYIGATSIDIDKFIDGSIHYDFNIYNKSVNYGEMNGNIGLSKEFVKELSKKDIVNKCVTTKYLFYESKFYNSCMGIDDDLTNKITIFDGNFDLEKWKTGKYVIIEPFSSNNKMSNYNVGDALTIKGKDYEVMCIGIIEAGMNCGRKYDISINTYITQSQFDELFGDKDFYYVMLNVKKENIKDIEKYLKNYCTNVNINYIYESKETYKTEILNRKNAFLSIGILLTSIAGFIGILNYLNILINSIINIKREFSLPQCAGMTRKQLRKMLIYEGLYYILGTALIAFTFGVGIILLVVYGYLNKMWYFTIDFTLTPMLIILLIMSIITVIAHILISRMIAKKLSLEE